MIVQTERLYLRELHQNDFKSLCNILQDKDVMYAYQHAFTDNEVHDWLEKQLLRYKNDGFGLWAVILKENNKLIGQCGLTIQNFNNNPIIEIGYLFQKAYWHKGYAIEAARACKKYAFEVLNAKEVYSIIRDNNIPSQNVAIKNGMKLTGRLIKYYYNTYMPHLVFSVKAKDYYIDRT